MRKKLIIILLSITITILFTSFLYNFISINNHYLRIILLILFNFFLCVGLLVFAQLSNYKVLVIALFPTLLVDMSVIYTNQALIPYRFPLMTTFSILGAFLGIFFYSYRKTFFILLFLCLIYLIIAVNYLIPSIFYQIEERSSEQLKIQSITNNIKFIDKNRKIVFLDSLLKSKKCTILEIYFEGCSPCIEKCIALEQIANKINSSEFQIIMVCDGRVTSMPAFMHSKKIKNKNFVYLFDNQNGLKYLINNSLGYPTEVLFKNKEIISIHSGYNETSREIYLENNIKKIKTIINE